MKIILTFLCVLITCSVLAQDYTQTVKGKVIDTDTKVALPGANVLLFNNAEITQGTSTDIEGNFRLSKVPIGRHNFKISFIGYEDIILSEVLVGSGKEVILNIEMKESVATIYVVTVSANVNKDKPLNQMATVSATQITVESTSRMAAGLNDPARTAQSLAGVSSANDENNELVIRGNSPRGTLWRMEGIEIPNPNHFSDGEASSGGGISALSAQVLANSDFFTGAFPAEYGNALSGVFDLNLRRGNYEKKEYSLQLGVLGAQASIEGPFKKGSGASYLLNYRYSTLKVLQNAGIDISGGDIAPEWQDLSYKFYFPTNKIGYFSIWGLGGNSEAGSTVIRDTSLWEYRGDRFEESENHKLAITGVTHNYLFKNLKTYVKTVATYSYTNNSTLVDSLDFNFNNAPIKDNEFIYKTFSVSSFINHKFNAKNIVRIGAIFHDKAFNLEEKEVNFELNNLETIISNQGKTNIFESFVQWKYRVNKNIDINSGLHYTHLALNNSYAVEPRLGVKWDINKIHQINFGAGLHSKIEPVSIYLAEQELQNGISIMPNKGLELTKAIHVVLGYNWNFSKDFRFKTEVYYQHLYDVPVKPDDTSNVTSVLNFSSGFTNQKLVNKGTGRNYGAEFTLQKFFSNNWYMLVTASLFESKYKMMDNIERNTRFNGKYIGNLVGGKEFLVGKGKQNIIGTNIRTIWRGGYRTIPLNVEESNEQNKDVRIYDEAFETKAPDYFRVDVGVSFRKNKPTWSWVLSLDIQNVTNRSNIWDQYYSAETKRIEQSYMIGLVPVLNYRIEF